MPPISGMSIRCGRVRGRRGNPSPVSDLNKDRLPLLLLLANHRATARAQAKNLLAQHLDIHGPGCAQIVTDTASEWAETFIQDPQSTAVLDLAELSESASPATVELIVSSRLQEGPALVVFDVDTSAGWVRDRVLSKMRQWGRAAICVVGDHGEPEGYGHTLGRLASITVDLRPRVWRVPG